MNENPKEVLTAIALRQKGLKTCAYHGKNMSSHDKLKALENWQLGEVEVMVNTSAFGIGVDGKDVDVLVKIGVPRSLEELVKSPTPTDFQESCSVIHMF